MLRRAIFLLLLLPAAAWATPKDDLAKTQAALKASQEQQVKLAAQQAAVERDLTALQEKLVSAAAAMQKSDAQLAKTNRRLQDLTGELAAKEKDFAVKREKLDGLSRIAIRLSRTPPQAMVLMPTDGKNRIEAAQALSLVTSQIKTQALALKKDMETLHDLKTQVEAEKQQLEEDARTNREQKKSFEAALKARKQLRDKLVASKTQEEGKAAELARKASSLQDLITALNNEAKNPKKVWNKPLVSESGISGNRGKLRAFDEAKGKIRVPVSGRLITAYGDRDGNDASKGIKIAAQNGATVVATYDAEVAYSGTFLNYGRLVILKHRSSSGDNFHTLLSGLARIDVKTGDFLLEGEPIGAMGNGENQQLYVELRENNQPVNPEKWMHGL